MIHPTRKLGLLPRSLVSNAPHWSSYAMRKAPLAPLSCNNYLGMAMDSSILGNDQWGDCAIAATYREVEILSFKTSGVEMQASTDLALRLYAAVTGFDPTAGASGSNPTDQGTNLQDLLTYRINTGIPLPNGNVSKLLGFFEIDPRNLNDVRAAIAQGGIVQLGISCYESFMDVQQGGVWEPPLANDSIGGGHAICSGAYDQTGFTIKSWGLDIQMPIATWRACVTEVYAVVSPLWVSATGKTPFGMSIAELEQVMQSLKE